MIATALLILIGFITCFLLFYASSGEDETWDPDLDSDALSPLARKQDRLLRILKDLAEEKAMGSIAGAGTRPRQLSHCVSLSASGRPG